MVPNVVSLVLEESVLQADRQAAGQAADGQAEALRWSFPPPGVSTADFSAFREQLNQTNQNASLEDRLDNKRKEFASKIKRSYELCEPEVGRLRDLKFLKFIKIFGKLEFLWRDLKFLKRKLKFLLKLRFLEKF